MLRVDIYGPDTSLSPEAFTYSDKQIRSALLRAQQRAVSDPLVRVTVVSCDDVELARFSGALRNWPQLK